MAIDNLHTEQFREFIVTDVEFVFDFGVKDSLTLRDTDVLSHNPTLGTVEVILAPKDPGRFPEYISYQTSKIIVMRKCQRLVRERVVIAPLPPLPPVVAAAGSAPDSAVPESPSPSETDSLASTPPRDRPASTSSGSPTRPRQTPRAAGTPRRGKSPAVDSLGATASRTPGSDSDETS